MRALALASLLAAALALAACGGGKKHVSSASLARLVPPASALPGNGSLERSFSWDNAIDLTTQGIMLPEITAPSEAVKRIDDDGFAGAAGERVVGQGGGPRIQLDVVKLGSAADARKLRDYLHAQDLKPPCFRACVVTPRDLPLSGVPGSAAVHQAPNRSRTAGEPPFERYLAEFTVGSYLGIASTDGDPGDVKPAQFATGATGFYRYLKQRAAS